MKQTAIRLYSMDAAILMFRNLIPDKAAMRKFKKNKIKTMILEHGSPGREGTQLQKQVDSALDDLNASPQRTVIITDDPRYLRPARKLKMAMRIGVAPFRKKKRYYMNGADIVINSMDEMSVFGGGKSEPMFSQSLPNIFSELEKFHSFMGEKRGVFFFDYDGTLAPIVRDPAEAVIDKEMRKLLNNLAEIYPVAIVSGRDLSDIRDFVGLDNLIYAGSHGFRIKGPDHMYMENREAASHLGKLDSIEKDLRKELEESIDGVEVERKLYAIAIHYRNAAPGTSQKIRRQVSELLQDNPGYRTGRGKKILEIKPDIDWNKGKAIGWILKELGLDSIHDHCPVYLGDDLTDEDAFRYLADEGLGILVGDHGHPSAARYHLKNVGQVKQFLHHLVLNAVYV